MHRIRLFALMLMLGILLPGSTQSVAQESEGAVLFVAPHRLIVPPGEKVSIISIANKSDKSRRYDLTVVDQAMGEDGVTKRVDTFPYSIKRMVKFQPKRFSLKAGERQTVRIMIDRPADLADGDYHSHLLFREVPLDVKTKAQLEAERKAAQEGKKTTSFEIRTLYGIGVPVVVQHGKIVADMNIGEPKLGGTAPDGKRRLLSVDFTRIGNAEAAGKLTAEYLQPGQEPVRVLEPQWVRLYHEVDKVTKNFPLNLPVYAQGGKIVVSLTKDEADESKTIKKEVAFN